MAVACVAILAAVVVLALGATRPSKNNAKHGHTPGNTCHTCRQAEAALRTRSAFLAAISHDLRTAMNAVVGMLELTLVSGSLGFAEKRQLSTALDASRSLLTLVNDLLDLSQLESGKFAIRPQVASVPNVVHEVRELFAATAQRKALTLDARVSGRLAPAHLVDTLRLKQVLNNLVSNAICHTRRGRVRIRVAAAPASVLPTGAGIQWIRFTVSDTGVGIPPAALPTLFEPFVQANTPGAEGGVGLGLSICKQLVDAMGGRIRVYSRPQRGTRVHVELPLAISDGHAGALAGPPAAKARLPILVVDDHAPNRILLNQQLQTLGHRAVCIEDGAQALAATERQAFKLVICDCAMPRMNGLEFVRALRAGGSMNAAVPVLGYTAGVQKSYEQALLNAGMDAVLVKPVGLADLQRAQHAHLAGEQQPGGS
ncbi:hypothetical protein CAL19_16550 [Bordetella genomosp. 7]|uniref:histidine kinase n=1 Tax=Bordetella genomosp. 7 TaxID=1416805 RepID=A0A261QV87_9BORD|nr:hypothetical protein CAL19_16550 [Bordetella genomosp. 7]